MKKSLLFCISTIVCLTAACEGRGVIQSVFRPLNLTITQPSLSANPQPGNVAIVGQPIQFQLFSTARSGDQLTLNGTTFELSDPSFGEIDANGRLIPKKAGTVFIIARIGSFIERLELIIQPLSGPLVSPSVPLSVPSTVPGISTPVTPLPTAQPVQPIASVTPAPGVSTPAAQVTPTPTVSQDNLTISIAPGIHVLNSKGERAQFIARVKNGEGQFVDLSQVSLQWSSSQPTQVSVGQDGWVTAEADNGSATITVWITSQTQISASAQVNIMRAGCGGACPIDPNNFDNLEGIIDFN